MSHIGRRDEFPDTEKLSEAMLRCGLGQPAHIVAQAALDVVLAIWKTGGVTYDQAIEVLTSQARSRFAERSN
jgi:hypothetical protein